MTANTVKQKQSTGRVFALRRPAAQLPGLEPPLQLANSSSPQVQYPCLATVLHRVSRINAHERFRLCNFKRPLTSSSVQVLLFLHRPLTLGHFLGSFEVDLFSHSFHGVWVLSIGSFMHLAILQRARTGFEQARACSVFKVFGRFLTSGQDERRADKIYRHFIKRLISASRHGLHFLSNLDLIFTCADVCQFRQKGRQDGLPGNG